MFEKTKLRNFLTIIYLKFKTIEKVPSTIKLLILEKKTFDLEKLRNEIQSNLDLMNNEMAQLIMNSYSIIKNDYSTCIQTFFLTNLKNEKKNVLKKIKKISFVLREKLTIKTKQINILTELIRLNLNQLTFQKSNVKLLHSHYIKNNLEVFIQQLINKSIKERIAYIYLFDSVIKNVGKKNNQHLEKHIIGIMISTYKYSKVKQKYIILKLLRKWYEHKTLKNSIHFIYGLIKQINRKKLRDNFSNQLFNFTNQFHVSKNKSSHVNLQRKFFDPNYDLNQLLNYIYSFYQGFGEFTVDVILLFECEQMLRKELNFTQKFIQLYWNFSRKKLISQELIEFHEKLLLINFQNTELKL